MTYKKNLGEFSSFSWKKRRLRKDLLAVFNHLSSSCKDDRARLILNITQKNALKKILLRKEAMNILCIKGNSYLIQRSLAVRMFMPREAASQEDTQHLLKGGSNCKASPALSKEVDHLTSKGPIQILLVCDAMNICEHTHCVAAVLHGWPRT